MLSTVACQWNGVASKDIKTTFFCFLFVCFCCCCCCKNHQGWHNQNDHNQIMQLIKVHQMTNCITLVNPKSIKQDYSRWHSIMYIYFFSLFFIQNNILYFTWIVCWTGDPHEMLSFIFSDKMSSDLTGYDYHLKVRGSGISFALMTKV